jgi:diketogulonate reductase-like aldo/keto reductase
MDSTMVVGGVQVPRLVYGTAWKEDDTRRLTALALHTGFRGIDTANQRRHYHESAVGEAIAASGIPRSQLFLQTKFTFRPGQDHRLPYDPGAPIAEQVRQSFKSSLVHLQVSFIDSYVLHGPMTHDGLTAADWQAWHAMEELHDSGQVRFLGISNVSHAQLRELFEKARIQPRFVQNRCYANRGWDRQVRAFCTANSITYQGFSLLTANRAVLGHADTVRIARKYGKTPAQVVFRFALAVSMMALTGTTDPKHMSEDLSVIDFELAPDEVERIEESAIA